MVTALWIVGGWVGLSVSIGIIAVVASILRDMRGTADLLPIPGDGVSRPVRAAPPQ